MTGSYTYLLVKAVITLLFVLALLGLCVYVIRHFMVNRSSGAPGSASAPLRGSTPVRVLFTSFLGSKKNLAVVEVAGEVIVLGVTQTSINFLTKIEDSAAVEEIRKYRGRKNPLFGLFQGGL